MAADEAVEEKSRRRKGQEESTEQDSQARGVTQGKGKQTPGKRNRTASTDNQGNFIVRSIRSVQGYFQGVRDELRKVVWPTREELIRLSRIVIVVTLATSAILGAFSFLFTELFVLGFENSLVFVGFGVAVLALYFYITRVYLKRDDTRY
ncbi:MAG: preprotein translocase subunit SecE [Phototrophicales bacterium]|nr:MAG: preprotein translocase subunit SecE [Phototrophicales bacterium]RMG73703.1 MAG: preprotein translocase subunit SecE [Chloroflexota bacterium]